LYRLRYSLLVSMVHAGARGNAVTTDLVSVEGPRSKLHMTLLLVEREVLNVDRTRALVYGRRDPQHFTVVEDDDVRLVRHLVLAIGAAAQHAFTYPLLRST